MDPFDVLEEAVRPQDMEAKAAKVFSDSRARLILGNKVGVPTASVFFGTLAMSLQPEPCWEVETAATDGKKLIYNPKFLVALTKEEAAAIVVHEIMHPAMNHHTRRGRRDPKKWNIACDLAINGPILEAGFQLPKSRLLPGEGEYASLPPGLAADEYYALLPEPPGQGEDPGEGPGGGPNGDPGGCGGVQEPPDASPSTQRESEGEWKVKIAQAETAAKQRGALPWGLARMVGETLAPKVDWRAVLREFVSKFAKNDFAWSPPNKKLLSQGLYLPSLRSEELGDVIVAVDTSGSIGEKELQVFSSELQGILECFDCSLTILYHDTDVNHVQRWKSSDGPLVLEARGGGGTSHQCVFEWIEKHGGDDSPCLVCLTDLYTEFPSRIPEIPTLWAVLGNTNPRAPFGQIVEVKP